MADNTRLKELQAEQKRTNEFLEEACGRFLLHDKQIVDIRSALQSLVKSVPAINLHLDKLQPAAVSGISSGVLLPQPSISQAPFLKSVKIDFPRSVGTDSLNLIFKAERYFRYYDILDPQRLVIASVHFDSDVLPWFQMMEKAGRIPHWFALAKSVDAHFGPSPFDCARSQLFKLTQLSVGGVLDDYNTKFLAVANRTDDVPESALVDCYLGGLKPDLKRDVLVQRPTTVLSAMTFASLFAETSISSSVVAKSDSGVAFKSKHASLSQSKAVAPYSTPSSGLASSSTAGGKSNFPPLLPTPSAPPIKRMTPAEM